MAINHIFRIGTPIVLPAIASVGEQQSNGDVSVIYSLDAAAAITVEVVVFAAIEADPSAADFNGGGAPTYVDQGTVELPPSSGSISLDITGTFNGSVKIGLLPVGGTDSDVVVSSAFTLDTTAPTLSSPTGTQTGQTTADWGVTSNEASGTIYAGVRPTESAALTVPQLVAGSGGAGVAWNSDATPTADANNGGSFTGLTAATAYKVDIVQVDAVGNTSAVSSSAEFTTASAGAVVSANDATSVDTTSRPGWTIYTWDIADSPGSITFSSGGDVEALAVGGGGGGGGGDLRAAGGGGGGELVTNASLAVTATSYTITVGAGGTGGSQTGSVSGTSGGASSIGALLSAGGGGGGGGRGSNGLAALGGGGGAGAAASGGASTGTGGSGGDAANWGNDPSAAAGGGGASGNGADSASLAGGNGGAGAASSITGSSVTYGGGGGGGQKNFGTVGTGGAGGGGDGGRNTDASLATAGTDGLGGGGGGGGATDPEGNGANGGAGRVIIAVQD